MGTLLGFKETQQKVNSTTFFDYAVSSAQSWTLLLNDGSSISGVFTQIDRWDVRLETEAGDNHELPKHDIELMYLTKLEEVVRPHITIDPKVQKKALKPDMEVASRFHIKNKSLYVLFDDKEAISVTTLSGRKVSGKIGSFARFEIVLAVRPKVPIVLMRHAVLHATNSTQRCILCSTQNIRRDWEKSKLWQE